MRFNVCLLISVDLALRNLWTLGKCWLFYILGQKVRLSSTFDQCRSVLFSFVHDLFVYYIYFLFTLMPIYLFGFVKSLNILGPKVRLSFTFERCI